MTIRKACLECGQPIQHSRPPLKIWCSCDERTGEQIGKGGSLLPKKWLPDIVSLECCCCGGGTRGRQWRNRDTDYGICPDCITYARQHGESEEQIRDCYGIEGIHWGIQHTGGKQ